MSSRSWRRRQGAEVRGDNAYFDRTHHLPEHLHETCSALWRCEAEPLYPRSELMGARDAAKKTFVAASMGGLLAGCATAVVPGPDSPAPSSSATRSDEPTTAFTIANEASSFYRIDKVVLVLDGSVLLDGELGEGERARQDLGLVFGDHVLHVLVRASYPSGSIDERCAVEIRAMQPFHVDGGSDEIAMRIETGAITVGFADRIDLSFDLRDAREVAPTDFHPAPSREEEACAKLGPLRGAACTGEILLAGAERDRDVIKTLCYRDKMNVIRSYVNAFGGTEAELAEPGGVNRVSTARRADLAAITKSAVAARDAMEGCVSGGGEPMPERTRAVVGENCSGTAPFDDGTL